MMELFIYPVRMISSLEFFVTDVRMRSCICQVWPQPQTASPCVRTMMSASSSPTPRVMKASAGYTSSVITSRTMSVGRMTVWLDPSILTLMTAVCQRYINLQNLNTSKYIYCYTHSYISFSWSTSVLS